MVGIVKGPLEKTAVDNVDPSLVNALREIEGFDDFFGSQNSCECEKCNSILSPGGVTLGRSNGFHPPEYFKPVLFG